MFNKTAHADYVKCFPACLCFLNLHIGAKDLIPELLFRESYSYLKRSGTFLGHYALPAATIHAYVIICIRTDNL